MSFRKRSCNLLDVTVPDPDAPYYTNDTCSVIHEHYDCMKFGKAVAARRLRASPPRPSALPRRDEGQVHGLRGGFARQEPHALAHLPPDPVAEPTASWPSSKHTVYRYGGEHNFTVANFWAPHLVWHEQIDEDGPVHTGLWNLYLDEPDPVWAAHAAGFDYIVVSASSWFYRPSMLYEAGRLVGCHHCLLPNVTDLTLRYALRMATRAELRALGGAGASGGAKGG
ncbi:hypothetical protein ACP70R_028123 [Stipagrostis hirtigluma subsp. patula]